MADDPSWTPRQDMSLLCRVCANQHDYLIPIFEGEGLDHDMPNKMDKHLPIKVRENDKLPTQMCYQCASTIIAWSELVTNCLEADKKLSRMLKVNENKADTSAIADEDAGSDHYEDAYDDVGGGGDDDNEDDDEDFEKEIKQLISDAGVKIVVPKAAKAKTTRASTRKRKSEAVPVKKENKKSKPDTSVSKSSTALIKPKEEVTSGEDRCMVWSCCKCVAKYTSWSRLQVHMISHRSDAGEQLQQLICIACQGSMDSHHSPAPYQYFCAHCDQVFTERKILVYHLKIEHCDTGRRPHLRWFACHTCGNKTFTRTANLRMHMQDKHFEFFFDVESFAVSGLQDITYPCEQCEELCFLSKYCFKHKASSTLQPSSVNVCSEHGALFPNCHSCQKCDESFDDCNNLWSHMLIKHANSDLVCNLCSSNPTVSIKYPQLLVRHMKQRHKTTISIPAVYNHIRERTCVTTTKSTRYKCLDCPVVLKTFASLLRHLNAHSDQKDFPCQSCDKCFATHSALQTHNTSVHTKSGKHKCRECERAFISLSKLTDHVQIQHTKEKSHVCEICGASFLRRRGLIVHKYTHEGTLYICPHCYTSFKNPLFLKRHLRETHSNSKNVCEICGKEFKQKKVLKEHMALHSADRPFVCNICDSSFKLRKYLMSHYKTHQKGSAKRSSNNNL